MARHDAGRATGNCPNPRRCSHGTWVPGLVSLTLIGPWRWPALRVWDRCSTSRPR